MSRIHIPTALRRLVLERAQGCCEYCLIHQDDTPFAHPLDHVLAIKHGGRTLSNNLALACVDCNRRKGSDLTSIDPLSGVLVPLFNPRTQQWYTHFGLIDATIRGQTPIGRATVILLRLNDPLRLMQRRALIQAKRYPPAMLSAHAQE